MRSAVDQLGIGEQSPRAQPTSRAAGARRPKVVLIQTQAENAGAQEVARLVAAGLAARGYDTAQLFFFRRTKSFDDVAGTLFCAPARPPGPIGFLAFLWSLFMHLRQIRPDVALTFQHYGNIIGAPMARLAGVRHVIANQTTTLAALHPAVRRMDRLLGQTGAYDAVVMNSDSNKSDHAGHPKSYRDRIVHIAHGFERKTSDFGKSDARSALGLPLDVPLLGGVGRLHPSKNWEAAVCLLPERPLWRLALAGQGPDAERLTTMARTLGCADRLHLLGELQPSQIGTFLAGIDVFVFPTLAETFGLAAVEAAQAGVPVVANRLPVLEEVLCVDGEPCAVFADASDRHAMTAAIDRVLADGVFAHALGSRARRLDQSYSLDAMVDQYAALIGRLAAAELPLRSSASAR